MNSAWTWLSGLALAVIIGFVVWAAMVEQKQWNQFAIDHHCKVTRTERAQVLTTVTMDGKVANTTIPARNTYLCDDGKEYVR